MMNKTEYLNRLDLETTEIKPNLSNLKILQRQHLLKIPFENLDIHWDKTIVLETDKFFQKIVKEKRGGFCYELNGLFYWLLNQIGFKNKIISARVKDGNGDFGEEYDHLAILTKIDDAEYLVDVGFGDFTAEPLQFVLDVEQLDPNGTFLIRKFDVEYLEVVKKTENDWKSEYIFKDSARDLSEFSGMCKYHQTSPESHFTRGKVCSLMTEIGRKTLTDKKIIVTNNDEKTEMAVNSEEEFYEILEKEFGIKK